MYALDVMINFYSCGIRDYFGIRGDSRKSIRLKTITNHLPEYYSYR